MTAIASKDRLHLAAGLFAHAGDNNSSVEVSSCSPGNRTYQAVSKPDLPGTWRQDKGDDSRNFIIRVGSGGIAQNDRKGYPGVYPSAEFFYKFQEIDACGRFDSRNCQHSYENLSVT